MRKNVSIYYVIVVGPKVEYSGHIVISAAHHLRVLLYRIGRSDINHEVFSVCWKKYILPGFWRLKSRSSVRESQARRSVFFVNNV